MNNYEGKKCRGCHIDGVNLLTKVKYVEIYILGYNRDTIHFQKKYKLATLFHL